MELQLTGCVVDLKKRIVDRGGTVVRLTTRESELLCYLVKSPNTSFSDFHLLEKVWGYNSTVISRAVDQLLYRLRRKIEVHPSHPDHLIKVYGEGLRFKPLASASSAIAPSTNLPHLPTWNGNFHGRKESIDYLDTHANRGHTMAVTGLSGIGKTRLVVHWLEEREGTRLFASRDELVDSERLAMTLGKQLDAPPDTGLETLCARLGPATLVLDDVPTDVEGARTVVASVCRHPNLTVVYTALLPMDIPNERVLTLTGLSAEASTAMLADLADATEAPPSTGSTTRGGVAALVELLGGHPLALVLCAPRCRALGARETERHWRFGSDTTTERHMAHAVARSLSLLSTPEQMALLRLCAFDHGTDVLGAEALFADVGGIATLEELVRTGFAQVSPRSSISDGMWVDMSRSVMRVVREMNDEYDETEALSRMANRLCSLTHRLGETTTMDRHMAAAHQPAILRVLDGEVSDEQRVKLTFLSVVASLSEPKSQRHLAYRRLGGLRPLLTDEDQGTFAALRLVTASSLDMVSCQEEAQALWETQTLPPAEQVSLALVVEHALTRLGRPQEGLTLLRDTIAQFDGEQVPDYPRVRLWTQYAWRCTHHAAHEELFRAASAAVELAARIDDPARICRAWNMMGIANGENARDQAAIDAYTHAISVGIPGHEQTLSAMANLGYHLCRIGRSSEGLPLLRQVVDEGDTPWNLKVKATRQLSLIPFVAPDEARARLSDVDHMMRVEAMQSIEVIVAAEWAIVEAQASPAQARVHLDRAIRLAEQDEVLPSSPTGRRIEVAKQRVTEAEQLKEE